MRQITAPFQTTITYIGGRLVVVSHENEGYRFPLEQLHQMLAFTDLMLAWTKPRPLEVRVGPYFCTPTGECDSALPFELADGNAVRVTVAPSWIELMLPVFRLAQRKIKKKPAKPFTLVLKADGSIEELPPERTTLRPG